MRSLLDHRPLRAQDKASSSSSSISTTETVAKPLTKKQLAKKARRQLEKELEDPWKKWLNEDVAYIITDEERKPSSACRPTKSASSSSSSSGCAATPRPDTVENEFKEEHYRRIAYANEHFASGIPGWKTDRGRIYITYGPPDEIESHPSGGTYERPMRRRRRRHLHLSLRALALSLHRGHRHRHHHRIRRSHHVRRISHDHGPVGKGRPALRARRRPDADGADGHGRQDRSASTAPTARTWAPAASRCRKA